MTRKALKVEKNDSQMSVMAISPTEQIHFFHLSSHNFFESQVIFIIFFSNIPGNKPKHQLQP